MSNPKFWQSAGGASIGALGGLVTTGINYAIQQKQWNQQVAHEQSTYERNRADYLSDLANERAYNSPQETINRIREAGLNPNLINGGQLVSGQMSSGAQPMPTGSQLSPNPVSMSDPTSGIAAYSNAMVARRKSDEEITSLRLSNEYKSIELSYLKTEKELSNAKTIASINESISRAQKNISDISLNNSTIDVNGKRIDLISSQIDKNVRESALIHAKTVVENLNADKLRSILPYVQAMEERKLEYMRVQTDAAKEQCRYTSIQADLAFVQKCKEEGLLDAGYCDAVISQIEASARQYSSSASNLDKDTSLKDYNAKSKRRSANAQIIGSIGGLIRDLALAGAGIKSMFSSKSVSIPNIYPDNGLEPLGW